MALPTVLHRDLPESQLHVPKSHTHDDRYLTKAEVQALINSVVAGGVQIAGELAGTPASPLLRNVARVFSARDYGAVGDGTTNDQPAIQAAVNAASAAGGGDVSLESRTFKLNASLELKSNVCLVGSGQRGTVLTTTMTASAERSILNVTGQSNVVIENLKLSPNQPGSGNGVGAITSYGHSTLRVRNVEVTGTTNTTQTVIQLSGGSSAAAGNFDDTVIEDCVFHDLPNTVNCIRLYPRNGHKVLNTKVLRNRFIGTREKSVMLDCYDDLINTVVDQNVFLDIAGNVTNAGSAVWTGSLNYYYIDGLTITRNDYVNRLVIAGQDQGFAFFYTCRNVTIDNNRMIGSWTETQNTIGPALAPGRIYLPVIGLKVTNNIIIGFDAAWDPDSMRDAEVSGNTVIRCGQSLGPGYGIQERVNIHDNFTYNSNHRSPVSAATALGSATLLEKDCRLVDNTYLDDRPVPAPASLAASLLSGGSLTVGTTLYYRVSCTDPTGESVTTAEAAATPTSGSQRVSLTWPMVEGAEGYRVYRSITSGSYGVTSLLTTESQPSFIDAGTVALKTGTPVASSTVQQPGTTVAVFVHGGSGGGINHSNTLVKGNKFRLPRSTYTTLLKKELPDTVLPRRFEDNEFEDANGRVTEYVHAQVNVTGATTFDRANGAVIAAMLTGNVTATVTAGLVIGETLQLRMTQDATGSRTLTWPTNVKLSGGAFVLSTTANVTDILTLRWDSTNWREIARTIQDAGSIRTVTAATTLTANDVTVLANATSAAFTVTYPSAAGLTGKQLTVKRVSAGANVVTIAFTGGQTLDGATTFPLGNQWDALTALSDGSNWLKV